MTEGDYRRDGEELWSRFNVDAGRRGEVWYYRRLAIILPERLGTVDGRPVPLGVELQRAVGELRAAVAANPDAPDEPVLDAEWERSLADEAEILQRVGLAASA